MTRMSWGCVCLALFGAICLVPVAAVADVDIAIVVTYYECVAPESIPPFGCVATEQSTEECPDCTGWREVNVGQDASLEGQVGDGSWESANLFLAKASAELYGTEYPQTAGQHPVPIQKVFAEPAKYGFATLPDAQQGALVVFVGGLGGVVTESDNRQVEVIYPSHAQGGRVRSLDLDFLEASEGQPRFLIPKEFLEKARPEIAPAAPPPPQ